MSGPNWTQYPETPTGGLIMPDGRVLEPHLDTTEDGVQRVGGLMTRSEWDQLMAVLRAKFFLFRNNGGDVGERMKCETKMPDGTVRGCGRYHSYVTYMCVERPFKGGEGLEAGLYLMFRAARDPKRKAAIQNAIGRLPDLSVGHPFSAHAWAPKADDMESWMAALVSLPVAITKEEARKYAVRINTEKNPPFPFCLHESCENYLDVDLACPRTHKLL